MTLFAYKPLDLERFSIRLVRLFPGHRGDEIRCELLHDQLREHHSENGIPYEALSYTWGPGVKPETILIVEKNKDITKLNVTQNLYVAMQYLRYEDEERFLWIDAICINQDDDKERTHQVRQMSDIYEQAERVIVWLGTATDDSNILMDSMIKFHRQSLRHSCNNETDSDRHWMDLWEFTQPAMRDETLWTRQSQGVVYLYSRPWFTRVWVLQEVANARATSFTCGTKSVPGHIFARMPSLLGIHLEADRQAVLDLIPNPSRKHILRMQKPGLHTLLLKFKGCESTDPRDRIFALLNISSDARNVLYPDYQKSIEAVIRDTISFLLSLRELGDAKYHLPSWTLADLFWNLGVLGDSVCRWAFKSRQRTLVNFLVRRGEVSLKIPDWYHEVPLGWATYNRYTDIMELLEERSDIAVGISKDILIYIAAIERYGELAGLLMGVDIDSDQGSGALILAVENGNEPAVKVVKVLLNEGAGIESSNGYGSKTPLIIAARRGHEEVIKLLLKNEASVKVKKWEGKKPFLIATETGFQAGDKPLQKMRTDTQVFTRLLQSVLGAFSRT